MQDWKPQPDRSADLRRFNLTAEEGFVLSRLDGATPASQLSALTGLPAERVQAILARLVEEGALLPGPPGSHTKDPLPEPRGVMPDEAADEPTAEVEDEEPAVPEPEGTFRQLFELQLHPLPADQRAGLARAAEEPQLSAFCFDPMPEVIKALLENPRAGLAQARLIARHHRNPVGLEALGARAAFAADAGARRWLVRNPQLPSSLFRRLYAGRRMIEQHKLALDREVPENTRRSARELLRSRFASGPAEERVELILNTEGRVLASLVGLALDGKTVSLLCGRPYRSSLLIQNFARWSAAPPPLIAHLLKQDAVKRAPQLRTLLLRHPNAPSTAK